MVMLAIGAARGAEIGYDFETPEHISGVTSGIGYAAPDINTFGAGVTVGRLELSDEITPATDYGRIQELGGGSVEAAVNDRNGNTVSFTVTIDETVAVDFSHIAFDTSLVFYNTGDTTVGWDFSTVVGDNPATNVRSSAGWIHDGGANYQSPGGNASGNIELAGLTGLSDTTVTFIWNLDSSRNNSFARAALGLDDIVLTGTSSALTGGEISADPQSVETGVDMPVDITLTSSGVAAGPLSYAIVDGPRYGTLDASGLPVVIYTPTLETAGPDSFTFTVSDGETTSAPATVSVMVSSAAGIAVTFDDPDRISGAESGIVYDSPDVNTFGSGVTVSRVELSDGEDGTSHYGRIVDVGGGSAEAALTDRGSPGTISFTVTVDDTVTIDLSRISFATAFRFTNTGDSTVNWEFSTSVGGVTGNETSGEWIHDGGLNYQSPAEASGDVVLAGMSGLTDTAVTFTWVLDSTRSNTFAVAALGLDDVVLEGAVVHRLPPLIYEFASDVETLTTPGTPVTLSWQVGDDVGGLSISPGIGDVLPLTTNGTGQTTVTVDAGTVFTLAAASGTRTDAAEVEIVEQQPEISGFAADDHYVQAGVPVVLSWEVSAADSVTITGLGDVGPAGQATVHPAETTTFVLVATNAFGSVRQELTVAVGPARPNILLMLVDDWGVTDLSVPFAYDRYEDGGTPVITNLNLLHNTPNLETLASMGMKFTQAYATPKCSSTRATLMTGWHPARHGITYHLAADSTIGNGPNEWRFNGLDATDVTLAHMLNPAHYRTIHAGKWHLGGPGDYAQYPTSVGFDINIGGSNAGSPARYVANAAGFASADKPMPAMEHYAGTGMYLTKALTIEMNQAMSDAVADGVPFFGYLSYYGVHDPETTNPDATGDYSGAINADHRKFCTMVEAIDVSFGDVVAHLEELGIAEETLIIHLGDNGSENPAHKNNQGQIPDPPFDDFPMRGMKNDGYQGGSRVPLMISWAKPDPDHPLQQRLAIAGGSVEHDIVGIEDIVPTILSAAGVEPPFLDGYDLSPYLRGEAGSHRPQKYLLHYPNGSFPNGQLDWYRDGDWKLMYGYEDDRFLLFNLADDPTESNDLAASEPARVVRMARAMARELDSKWGDLGKLWPVLAGTYPPRPGTDDPFLLSYGADGRATVDSDGDGLADAAEDVNGDGLVSAGETDSENPDSDGDRTGDQAELRLDLDPLDPNSRFAARAVGVGADSVTLAWPSSPGVSFDVLASDDLTAPMADWEVLVSGVAADESRSETLLALPVDAARRFFSVELLPDGPEK